MTEITLFTIGFTHKSADEFFGTLMNAGVRRVIDIRRNNVSQLAGFAKKNDLAYFLRSIGDIDYVHRPDLAPDEELLDSYRRKSIDWTVFEQQFTNTILARNIERAVDRALLDRACLLCSEATADRCHRRLVAEYLQAAMGDIAICHL